MTEPVTYTPPEPNAALVVRPDDVLVLSFPADTTPMQLDELRDHLLETHPSLTSRVLFVGGAQEIAVLRGAFALVRDAPHPHAALASPATPG